METPVNKPFKISTDLWRENARLLVSQHLRPCEDHATPRPHGWNHPRFTLALLIVLNLTLAFAIRTILP